jgi:hypothetical protein
MTVVCIIYAVQMAGSRQGVVIVVDVGAGRPHWSVGKTVDGEEGSEQERATT